MGAALSYTACYIDGAPKASCLEGLWLHTLCARSSSGTPLPKVIHKTLSREDVCASPGGRIFFVGDVHGCLSELRDLLEQEKFKHGRDTLILVGDLINKGPLSADVIRFARQHKAYAVRGNHDDELLEAWYRVGRFARGLDNYRHDTLRSVAVNDIMWVRELPLTLGLPWLGVIVAHAGVIPGEALQAQRFDDLLFMRDVKKVSVGSADCWVGLQHPEEGSVPWTQVWKGPEHVVFGHDARRKLQQFEYATGLDTGCVYGNHLSALIMDPDDASKKRVVQIPAQKVYSKPKGD